MKKTREPLVLLLPVPVHGRGGLLPLPGGDLRSALGLRPMALAEVGRESDRPCFALLSDDDDLLARAAQLGSRCGLKVSAGAITPPLPKPEETIPVPLVAGALLSGPRPGFEKLFEVLAVSGDPREGALARAGEAALQAPAPREIAWRGGVLRCAPLDSGGRPLVMGILNATPDSFSDGGRWADAGAAVARGVEMVSEGADLIDVGGESSRPGSSPVDAAEECRRVLPVIEALAGRVSVPISIDTTKADVARRAVAAGASIVNDISGMAFDPEMPAAVAELGVPVVLNHLRGVPKTMQEAPAYQHPVLEILLDLAVRVRAALRAGIPASRIVVDPGFGFGKRVEDNVALVRHLVVFRALGAPILAGLSRKSFLGAITGRGVGDRLAATLAAEALAAASGADILRTHEPGPCRDALEVARAIAGSP